MTISRGDCMHNRFFTMLISYKRLIIEGSVLDCSNKKQL